MEIVANTTERWCERSISSAEAPSLLERLFFVEIIKELTTSCISMILKAGKEAAMTANFRLSVFFALVGRERVSIAVCSGKELYLLCKTGKL